MKDDDFKGIMAGLEDAIAFVKGDPSKGHLAKHSAHAELVEVSAPRPNSARPRLPKC